MVVLCEILQDPNRHKNQNQLHFLVPGATSPKVYDVSQLMLCFTKLFLAFIKLPRVESCYTNLCSSRS